MCSRSEPQPFHFERQYRGEDVPLRDQLISTFETATNERTHDVRRAPG
jgi:hypothetical protein